MEKDFAPNSPRTNSSYFVERLVKTRSIFQDTNLRQLQLGVYFDYSLQKERFSARKKGGNGILERTAPQTQS